MKRTPTSSAASNWPEVDRQDKEDKSTLMIKDCSVDLFNVGRHIWKNITKGHLIQYYHEIADYILPHLRNRPQSLHIRLRGARMPGLYIKDMEGREPDCAALFTDKRRHKAEGKKDQINYLVCKNEATLLWMINLGCIDVNPWSSTSEHPNEPDYIIIDLDPSEKITTAKGLEKLRTVALATKVFCDEHRLQAFVKTSGKTGIHFLLPCSHIAFPQARRFAVFICEQINKMVPEISTINNTIAHRGERVYLDPSQNDYADTIAAPYSVRPFDLPLVSTPLSWNEINKKLDPRVFKMPDVLKRLKKTGDLFAGLYNKKIRISNNRILKSLQL